MGRHRLPSDHRRSPKIVAAVCAPAALLFAAGGSAFSFGAATSTDSVDDAGRCCVQIVAAAAKASSWAPSVVQAGGAAGPDQMVPASRWRVVHRDSPRVLPAGVAAERGLQVKTILAARSISAAFPEIHSIGGVRPDALRWHPNGLALDVMIPNAGSAAGIALGNEVVAFALKNADRFALQDAIWRGTYYTPNGPQGRGYGHYDHVHITTTGGGYPTGGEIYVR